MNGGNREDLPKGCIPKWESDILETDPEKKVLFVRPRCEIGPEPKYWEGFAKLYPNKRNKPWLPTIPAFENFAEVVVIGHDENPYHDPEQQNASMRKFDYDPAKDPKKPFCDIMEVVCKGFNGKCPTSDSLTYCQQGELYCTDASYNSGHIHFADEKWWYDTIGYTSGPPGPYGYRTPKFYPFPLQCYFTEVRYERIATGERPVNASSGLGHCSPLALNSRDPVNGPPNGTVQFSNILFERGTAAIEQVPVTLVDDPKFDLKEALRYVLVHEMGHGLVVPAESDEHCDMPNCIMCRDIRNWNWQSHLFGPGCKHGLGSPMDLAQKIHNTQH